jgi:hypothetical protein
MSASKKTNTKSTKSPAPATTASAPKTAAKTKTAPAVISAPAPARAAITPAPKAVAPKVAVPAVTRAPEPVKPIESKPVVTTIAARIDVGFGNALFLRGEGPGLNWEKGVEMNCVANDLWHITLPESASGYTFKFLLNDSTWSKGADFTATCGANVTLTPEF